MQHTEIVIAAVSIYLAPVGETFTEIQAAPAGAWKLLGTGGDLNLGEDGVTVAHEETLNPKRTLGSTGPVKVTRSEENLMVSGVLVDLALEEYAKVLNNVTVADTAADSDTGGYQEITLRQGPIVALFALLIRGEDASPYGESYNLQYEIPVVYQSANPSPVFTKGESADLAFEFTALEDENAATDAERFGQIIAQDAAPTG